MTYAVENALKFLFSRVCGQNIDGKGVSGRGSWLETGSGEGGIAPARRDGGRVKKRAISLPAPSNSLFCSPLIAVCSLFTATIMRQAGEMIGKVREAFGEEKAAAGRWRGP